MTTPRTSFGGSAAFAVVITTWGSSYLFIRLAIDSFTPFGLVSTRFSLAACVCAALAAWRKESFPRGRAALAYAGVGVMMMSGSNALTAFAQHTVSSGVTSVVHTLSSVWLAAASALGWWGTARVQPRAWFGIIGGVVGVAVLAWPEDGAKASVLGLLALVSATLVFTVASRLQRWAQGASQAGVFASLAVQMGCGSLAGATFATISGQGFLHAPLTGLAVGAIAFLTLGSSVAGFAAFALLLKTWPAARLGTFSVVNPVVALALGVVFLHEPMTLRGLVGAAITLVSVAWVQRVS